MADEHNAGALPDDPELDGTDGAHPAWWRGQSDGVDGACARIEAAIDGMDSGAGVLGNDRLEKLRRKLLAATGQRAVPCGFMLVPVKPTPAMLAAPDVTDSPTDDGTERIYAAMLAASPAVYGQAAPEDVRDV